MTRRHGLAVVLCCVLALTARADDSEAPGVPPTWAIVGKVDAKGKSLQLRWLTARKVEETIEYQVKVGDRFKLRTRVQSRDVFEEQVTFIELYEGRIVTAAMKALSVEEALKRLKPDNAVLVYSNNTKLDPRYRALLRDDVLIVVMNPKLDFDPHRIGPVIIVPPPAPRSP
jgi:hypothetical protein